MSFLEDWDKQVAVLCNGKGLQVLEAALVQDQMRADFQETKYEQLFCRVFKDFDWCRTGLGRIHFLLSRSSRQGS